LAPITAVGIRNGPAVQARPLPAALAGAALDDNWSAMTLTQLNAFVLVARLGSVTAAANALGVSESAVSQALTALRQHLGDQLVSRGPNGMTLTVGGSRLLATASQIVVLGAEAHAAVRAARGVPEQLRLVATATIAEFVVSPLMDAFTRRSARSFEVSAGVAVSNEMAVLVANRLADVAIGPSVARDPALPIVSEPIFRYRLVVVAAGQSRLQGNARQWRWLVDPAGTDPGSDTGRLLAKLRIPENKIGVFPNQTAAWAAAADGAGVAPAVEHFVAQQLRRGELSLVDLPGLPVDACWHATMLERQHRSTAASALRRFLGTPDAMQLMRSPAAGIPPSRFRPPVYVTIWS
jgi:LysR family transcriptional regulator, low CO2-responsive transcriptional regulator